MNRIQVAKLLVLWLIALGARTAIAKDGPFDSKQNQMDEKKIDMAKSEEAVKILIFDKREHYFDQNKDWLMCALGWVDDKDQSLRNGKSLNGLDFSLNQIHQQLAKDVKWSSVNWDPKNAEDIKIKSDYEASQTGTIAHKYFDDSGKEITIDDESTFFRAVKIQKLARDSIENVQNDKKVKASASLRTYMNSKSALAELNAKGRIQSIFDYYLAKKLGNIIERSKDEQINHPVRLGLPSDL